MKRFLAYTEIKTKITSLFAFLVTLALLFYRRQGIDWERTGLFFASMFLFDLTTTAINNYIDTRTNGQELMYPRRTALAIIFVLLGASTAFGLWLALRTDIVVLLAGGLSFLCGIAYTWGPVPISRQPLGELLSGVFYGLFIPFLLLYINEPSGTLLTLSLDWGTLAFTLNLAPAVRLLLFSLPPVCVTANIMLANNICDVERDAAVKRHTLPYYMGNRASLMLFAGLYYLAYASVVAMVAIGMLHPLCLLALLTLIPVQQNINVFYRRQEKGTTFIVSIRNFILIMAATTVLIFASRFLG